MRACRSLLTFAVLTDPVWSFAIILEDDIPEAMISPQIIQSLAAFGFTLAMIVVLSKIAPRLGLMGTPSDRKRHATATNIKRHVGEPTALSKDIPMCLKPKFMTLKR